MVVFIIVIRFTQENILRVYPKGTRITSSNYKPMNGWMHGAQMIAFNMQVCLEVTALDTCDSSRRILLSKMGFLLL